MVDAPYNIEAHIVTSIKGSRLWALKYTAKQLLITMITIATSSSAT